jgi:hypothetical protein
MINRVRPGCFALPFGRVAGACWCVVLTTLLEVLELMPGGLPHGGVASGAVSARLSGFSELAELMKLIGNVGVPCGRLAGKR